MKTIDRLAFDFASVRTFDADGHLHVSTANISKAAVNPYLAEEVPGWRELGLEKGRIYNLLRDPKELAKAASTFTGKPLLIKHTPIGADDHPHDQVVGAIGEARYDPPFLKAPLHIWPGDAIELIKSGKQSQLSCAYRYEASMEPGTYEGERFDGRMKNIVANHCAIVATGRAGADVVVGDSRENLMKRSSTKAWQALASRVRTKLADSAEADEASRLHLIRQICDLISEALGPEEISLLASALSHGGLGMDSGRKALPILPHDRRLSGSGMGPVWPNYNRILGRR